MRFVDLGVPRPTSCVWQTLETGSGSGPSRRVQRPPSAVKTGPYDHCFSAAWKPWCAAIKRCRHASLVNDTGGCLPANRRKRPGVSRAFSLGSRPQGAHDSGCLPGVHPPSETDEALREPVPLPRRGYSRGAWGRVEPCRTEITS